MYKWQKKFGDCHIGGRNTTLCGIPMLGNNYANQQTTEVDCEKCIEAEKAETKELLSERDPVDSETVYFNNAITHSERFAHQDALDDGDEDDDFNYDELDEDFIDDDEDDY